MQQIPRLGVLKAALWRETVHFLIKEDHFVAMTEIECGLTLAVTCRGGLDLRGPRDTSALVVGNAGPEREDAVVGEPVVSPLLSRLTAQVLAAAERFLVGRHGLMGGPVAGGIDDG